jgi:murein L,D-transpeptidase YcbB/YkuD
MLKQASIVALVLTLTAVAPPAIAIEPDAPDRLITEEMALGLRLRDALTGSELTKSLPKEALAAIDQFYAQRNNTLFWLDGGKLGLRAQAVMAEIRKADDWGLNPADYPLPDDAAPGGTLDMAQQIDAELKLTKAALLYAHHARVGRVDTNAISKLMDRNSVPPEPAAVLAGLVTAEDPAAYLVDFHPKHEQFIKLRNTYIALRDAAAHPQEEPVVRIPEGPNLKPGDRHEQIALIRKRLNVPAPAGDPAAAETYDETLRAAVVKFQESEGLKTDGVIGRGVRRAMNGGHNPNDTTPKLERILANMERWRWLPADLGAFHIWDSVPEFMMRVVDNGRIVHEERIVVGKPNTPTPIFSDEMEFLEFNPFWNVPDSIKVGEIAPSLRASYYGSEALARHGLKVNYNGRPVDPDSVDWSTVDVRRFHFYQPPGGGNVLGVVKFMFPNRHDVYMHDTPSKGLFNEKVRTFSHGCMRVRNPVRLAEIIMAKDKGWSPADVARALASGNQQVYLTTKIPVHVTYFTTWVEDDGSLTIRGDFYGHDRRVASALKGEPISLASEEAVAERAASRIRVADNADPGWFSGSNKKNKHQPAEKRR